MIPGIMVNFLKRASVAVASTSGPAGIPAIHWLTGWSVDEGSRSVTCLVPEGFTEGLLPAPRDNRRLSMVAEVIGPHECYQFKGLFDESRPVEDNDRATHRACRQRFVDAVQRHTGGRFTDEALRLRFQDPVIAVRLHVEEVFVQTPGPSAGARLFPPEKS